MKMLVGNIPWRSILTRLLLCFVLAFFMIICYHSYISGTITIDEALLNDIENSCIDIKWEALLPLGFDTYSYNEKENYAVRLTLQKSEIADHFAVDLIQIYIPSEHFSDKSASSVHSAYRRVGLLNALWRLGSFGECTSWATFETPKCLIYMVDYDDSDGNAKKFEADLQTILNVIQ